MKFTAPSSRHAIVTLALLLVLACALATALAAKTSDGETTDPDNVAFVDQDATSAVLRDAQQIVSVTFSVKAGRIAATRKAAKASLVGDAVDQFDKLYRPILRKAKENQVTLETSPRSIGVIELEKDRGRLLVFADQSVSTADGRGTTGAARFELGMQRQGSVWKVASIELL